MRKKGIINIISILGLIVFISVFSVSAAETITLEEALNLGIENNIGIKESEIDKEKAEIDLDSAKKAFLPELSLSTSYTRIFLEKDTEGLNTLPEYSIPGEIDLDENIKKYIDGYMNSRLFPIEYTMKSIADNMSAAKPSKDNYQTAISLQQPIYLGGKLRIAHEQAEKGLEAAQVQYRQIKNELLFNIIQSYYNVLLAEERVRIEEDALELIQEHKRVAEVSYNAGISLKTDLLQVEIEESKAILIQESARNDLVMAKRLFGNIIGSEVKDKVFIEPILELNPELDKEVHISLAKENRAEFKLLEINQGILDLSEKIEKNTHLPNIVLVGNYQWQGSEFSLDDGTGSISLSLSMNIFDKGISNNSKFKLDGDKKKLALNKSNLEELVQIEIEDLLLRIEENKNNLRLQSLNLQRAEENLELEEKRYQAGTGTNMDILNAQMVLKQTKIASIQAEYQYEVSLYQLLEKTGQLVDYYEEVIINEG